MKPESRIICLVVLLGCFSVFTWSQTIEDAAIDSVDAGQTASPEAPSAPELVQNNPSQQSAFNLGISIAYISMQSGNSPTQVGWQKLGITPDIPIGQFGIGFDLNILFRFNGGVDGHSFEIRPDDWVVSSFLNFLEVYLPKIQYIRYGNKGDPVYLLLGSLYNGQLGNGFIVNGYTNTLCQPQQRLFGASFDLDGSAFSFPYIGFETMVGNLAALDLMAARFYIRPGAKSGTPALEGTQIGVSFATDTNPHYFSSDLALKANPGRDTVFDWGIDFMQPIVTEKLFSLNFLGDMAFQKAHVGGQIGFGGKAVVFLNYLLAVRYIGDNFIPNYFGASYDLLREEEKLVYDATTIVSPAYAGWLFNLGFSFLNNGLVFNFAVDGPFIFDPTILTKNPNLKITLGLQEGILAGFSFQAVYDKHFIRSWADLITPIDALISLAAGYKMGPAKISLIYDIRYDPNLQLAGNTQPWKVSSRLETSFDLSK